MWGNSKSPYICRLKTKTRSLCPAKWGGVLILIFNRWCLSHFSWKKKRGVHQSALDRETTAYGGEDVHVHDLCTWKRSDLYFLHQPPVSSVSEQKKKTTKPAFYLDSLIWLAGTSRCSLCPRCKTKPPDLTIHPLPTPLNPIRRLKDCRNFKRVLICRSWSTP